MRKGITNRAVSYTHLDVYKRQFLNIPESMEEEMPFR